MSQESISNETFTNSQIALNQVPQLQSLTLLPISPKHRIINTTLAFSVTGILLVLLSLVRFQSVFELPTPLQLAYPYAFAVILVLGSWWGSYHLLADKRIKYALREQDISLQSGLIFRSLACQPILRVQHVELKRGPLARLAGLASLRVYSAGGSLYTFEIPGIELSVAEQLRQFILDHKDVSAK